MNYILFDPPEIERFHPFTLTRPLGELRVFGGTLKQLWEKHLGCQVSYFTRDYLSALYPTILKKNNILLNPLGIFDVDNYKGIQLTYNNQSIDDIKSLIKESIESFPITNLHHLLSHDSIVFNQQSFSTNIHHVKNIMFNDTSGPIYMEEGVEIMEGAMIKGPVYICKGSIIKMGAKIYGPTVIGPYCKIGGEVSHSIFLGYSNKAHDGFLGHSIIGEWCNIGAGTNNSNLKNDYGTVKMWDYVERKFKDSGNQFLGIYMGDHSKCAINTSFNTGTTIGVNCNVFGAGFPRNIISSFSWGGAQGVKKYKFEKAISVAEIVMKRRGVKLQSEYVKMLRVIYDKASTLI